MRETGISTVLRAQSLLMTLHGVSSETALSLLVWAATDDDVTVLDVATSICRQADVEPGVRSHAVA